MNSVNVALFLGTRSSLIDFAIANAGNADRIIGEIKTYVAGEAIAAVRRAFAALATPPAEAA